MASAPRWCQIETTNRSRISGFVEDSATKSWRYRGVLGARHFTHRLLGCVPHQRLLRPQPCDELGEKQQESGYYPRQPRAVASLASSLKKGVARGLCSSGDRLFSTSLLPRKRLGRVLRRTEL
ncbi:MAG: hypothetical protein ACI9EF_002802 [Pseudohongiellaceae bacterium]|jgi:hypothetical protein